MFPLTLNVSTAAAAAGTVARLVDATDWSTVPGGRSAWAVLLLGSAVGSVPDQDAPLPALSYDPVAFSSGTNPVGTVEVLLPVDGVYRLQAVPVPVLASAAELMAAATGRLYYRTDLAQFLYKRSVNGGALVSNWAGVLDAAATDTVEGVNLLDRATDAFGYADFGLQQGLARLNLAYLSAGPRQREPLVHDYENAGLLVRGSLRQYQRGFYADAATTLRAAQRFLGACLPGGAESLPALGDDCGCASSSYDPTLSGR